MLVLSARGNGFFEIKLKTEWMPAAADQYTGGLSLISIFLMDKWILSIFKETLDGVVL